MRKARSSSRVAQCSFCGQEDNQNHQCRADIFSLLNRLAQPKTENPFSEIENLVFQGGGVKGIAYIGTFKALFDEHKLHEQIKRVAGSSAGAITALYVSLGLSTSDIAGYLETNLLEKLDDQPTVTVEDTEFSIRSVLERLLEFYGNYTKKDLIELVSDMVTNLLESNLGWTGSIASFFGSTKFAELIANYVFLSPSTDNNKTIAQRVHDLEDEITKEEAKYDNKGSDASFMTKAFRWPWSNEKPTIDKNSVFHTALSELLQQTFINGNPKFKDGWFAADKIKEDLILEPIRQTYKKIGQSDLFNKDLTFKDLAKVTVDGKPAFKKLYVTAFNTATERTDVFSVDHTPNVVVADAVRASMSIPIFFKAVKIRERVGDSLVARQIFTSLSESKDILYMDGGIMDNFAMWIFDDLQYCVGESFAPQWVPQQKIVIRNPFTLGIKLINTEQRKLYLNPYMDQERLRQKTIQLPDDPTPMNLIAKALFSDTQANNHIHTGDPSRTIYVDNLGVTTISFQLKPDEMKDFEKAGELGVRQYLNYFRWNKLSGIGEKYIPIQRGSKNLSEESIEQN